MAITKQENSKKDSNVDSQSIAIIGCGNMGSAIAQRLSPTNSIFLYDHHQEKAEKLAAAGLGYVAKSLKEGTSKATFVLLAVKPQNLQAIAQDLNGVLNTEQTLISILAGITLKQLSSYFPQIDILRMMPNTPLLCGEGMIALSRDSSVSSGDQKELDNVFKPLGKLLWLPEDKIDAFTALAGSGPAFIFAMTEAIIEAGIAMGFSVKEAQMISYQLLRGSSILMETSGKHPAELKWQVTSPAGTTIAGLRAFEEHAVRSGIMNTFLSTYAKAQSFR
jgi:pyrroline-5-carboxylate reductase